MQTPPGSPLPTAIQTALWVLRPAEFMRACAARYGEVYRVNLVGLPPIALGSEPEFAKRVFTADDDAMRGGEVNGGLAPLLGDGSLILNDGARHRRHRRLMMPAFQGERMRIYADVMRDLALARIARWRDGEPLSLREETRHITLEVILRTVFGASDLTGLSTLRARLDGMIALSQSTAGTLAMIPALRIDAPFSPWRNFVRRRAEADAAIFREIEARRKTGTAGRTDVLSLLIEARDEAGEALSDQELRDELVTLLVTGHETTSTAICWAFERMLAFPDTYARAEREVDDVTGGADVSPEHLGQLTYLDAVIKEAMRMRPIVPITARVLHVPFTFGRYEIPAGWIVAPSVFDTHYNPRLYPEPEAFRPERFVEPRTRPDPYAWFPFGGGSRRCLGAAFALYEMKIVMATILGRKRLELAQKSPVRIVRHTVTFTPERGLRVTPRSVAGRKTVRPGLDAAFG
jgi:cytochrome P450